MPVRGGTRRTRLKGSRGSNGSNLKLQRGAAKGAKCSLSPQQLRLLARLPRKNRAPGPVGLRQPVAPLKAASPAPSSPPPFAEACSVLRSPRTATCAASQFLFPPPTQMPFFGDFTESSDPAGAPVADPLQYIKECLPAESAACPLHVQGAWTALFKFFIGQPAEPGAFHKGVVDQMDLTSSYREARLKEQSAP